MARRERQGLILFHNVAIDTLDYLPAEDFKDVVMAAVKYSVAIAKHSDPPSVGFEGPKLGAYKQLCNGAEYSAIQWIKKAFNQKARRNGTTVGELSKKSNEELQQLGYTIQDIAVIRELPVEDVLQLVTDGHQRSPLVTNINENETNRTEKEKDRKQEPKRENKHERECEGDVPSLRSKLMIELMHEASVDIGRANGILNQYNIETVNAALVAWKKSSKHISFSQFLSTFNAS